MAVVGAGPAGALAAWHLARSGLRAEVFDPSHPREKPCGGGLTAKALALLPEAPAGDPLPARSVGRCELESGSGERVGVELARPVAIASRRELDAWLLRRAVEAGARHRAERVVDLAEGGHLQLASGERPRFDLVVGADGANSLVRRHRLGTLPAGRRMMAAGWLAHGDAPMLVRFVPDLEGYLWLFPRSDHVCLGICAPLGRAPGRALLDRLETEVARSFPALADPEARRYAHTIPFPAGPASLEEVAGDDWALVGDAAALADPITGEGIHPALASARALAETLVAGEGPRGYPARLRAACGDELLRAVRWRDRFYAPGFARRMVRYAALSAGVRRVLADLMLGERGYRGLEGRLLAAAPRLAWDRFRHAFRAA